MFKGSSCFAKSVRPVNRKQLSGGVAESLELIKTKLTEKGFNIFTTVNAAGGGPKAEANHRHNLWKPKSWDQADAVCAGVRH